MVVQPAAFWEVLLDSPRPMCADAQFNRAADMKGGFGRVSSSDSEPSLP